MTHPERFLFVFVFKPIHSRGKKRDSPGGTRTCTLQKQQKLNARPFPLCTIKNSVPASKLTNRAFKYHRTDKKKEDKPAISRSPDRRLVLSRPQGFPLNAWDKKKTCPSLARRGVLEIYYIRSHSFIRARVGTHTKSGLF